MNMFLPHTATLPNISQFVISSKGQQEITAWTEELKARMGNRPAIVAACQADFQTSPDLFLKIQSRIRRYVETMPPAHDRGHAFRDMLVAYALISQDVFATKATAAEQLAGLLAGWLHDIGNAVTYRYQDNKFGAGHSEIGAWLVSSILRNLLPDGIIDLACYGILCHPHYTRDIPVEFPKGYVRTPYFDELWEDNGQWYGLTTRIARLADRADASSPSQFARHLLAISHGQQEKGADFDGEKFVELSGEKLSTWLRPALRDHGSRTGGSTTAEWIFMYTNTSIQKSVYSADDHLFPVFCRIKELNARLTLGIITTLTTPADDNYHPAVALLEIRSTLEMVSRSPSNQFEEAWTNLKTVFRGLHPNELHQWQLAFQEIRSGYQSQLLLLQQLIETAPEPFPGSRNAAQSCFDQLI